MALLLCHSPQGGTGNTFMSAQLALALAHLGRDVTVMSATDHDPLPLHFGIMRSGPLPSLGTASDEAIVVRSIDLRGYPKASTDPYFIPRLQEYGHLEPGSDRVLIMDVPSGDRRLAEILRRIADLHICTLAAKPDCITLLPELYEANAGEDQDRMRFVLNQVDETRRLSRHIAAFVRELCGTRLMGKVHYDEAVPEAMASLQTTLRYAPGCTALADIREIADLVSPWLDGKRSSAVQQTSAASHAA